MRAATLLLGFLMAATPTSSHAWSWNNSEPTKEGPESGRFVMFKAPGADTFLLDTATGNVWQTMRMTDVDGQPTWWVRMYREDNLFAVKPIGPAAVKPEVPTLALPREVPKAQP
jgi:hypothetical protein